MGPVMEFKPLHLTLFPASVCKGAKADLTFLIDGSWSIGEESFTKVVQFVSSMIGAFDVIGPSGMQVCTAVNDNQGTLESCTFPSRLMAIVICSLQWQG